MLASIDINTVANTVYKHNFPKTPLLNKNIESLQVDFVNNLGVDTILMSPPCQPFTRNGLKGDIEDNRTSAFKCLLELIPQLTKVNRILMENVKGFEHSVMREMFIKTLVEGGFYYQEFILSPHEIGVPNSRHRYYCLASKKFSTNSKQIITSLNTGTNETYSVDEILEKDINFEVYRIPEKVLQKRVSILDVCYSDSKRSCCFTKAYGRYLEGTGSVYCEHSKNEANEIFSQISEMDLTSEKYLQLLRALRLRFFTPKEICRLMCFPESFNFPENISVKQKYMLLGNSVNVKVVSELIKLLDT